MVQTAWGPVQQPSASQTEGYQLYYCTRFWCERKFAPGIPPQASNRLEPEAEKSIGLLAFGHREACLSALGGVERTGKIEVLLG